MDSSISEISEEDAKQFVDDFLGVDSSNYEACYSIFSTIRNWDKPTNPDDLKTQHWVDVLYDIGHDLKMFHQFPESHRVKVYREMYGRWRDKHKSEPPVCIVISTLMLELGMITDLIRCCVDDYIMVGNAMLDAIKESRREHPLPVTLAISRTRSDHDNQ